MLFILAFISVCFADKKEYLSVEYNKGSFEIYEFGKCYCFTDDGCYQYKKKDDKTVTESKYSFNENLKCEGTPTNTDNTIGVANNGLKYTVVKELPKHSLHYFESLKNDCSDEKDRAKVILTDGHCEKNYYEDGAPYNTYTVKEEGGKKTINMKGFNDAECKDKYTVESKLDANTCAQIEGEGDHGKFIPEPYEAEPGQNSDYVGVEYNKGSIEMYELGECYCFANDGCYKYTKKDDSTVNEYYYEGVDSNCEATTEPEPEEYTIGTVHNKDMKFQFYTEIPEHDFHYIVSANGQCTDTTPRPINIFTEDNCERDYYSDKVIYRTYEITGESNAKKVDIAQYSDNQCQTPIQYEEIYEADKCLEDKIKFNTKAYELPGSGSSSVLIMMIVFIIFMIF